MCCRYLARPLREGDIIAVPGSVIPIRWNRIVPILGHLRVADFDAQAHACPEPSRTVSMCIMRRAKADHGADDDKRLVQRRCQSMGGVC